VVIIVSVVVPVLELVEDVSSQAPVDGGVADGSSPADGCVVVEDVSLQVPLVEVSCWIVSAELGCGS
jgi:hypothetical protein